MKMKLVTTGLLAGALALPILGLAATDSDSDRSSPKAFVKDSVITAKIKAQLAKERLSSAVRIKVDTDNKGVVSLSGTARSKAEVDKAVSIAHRVEGVTAVENHLMVEADK